MRGAPAIAIVAMLSLAQELKSAQLEKTTEEQILWIQEKLDYLRTSRPTAVNLEESCRKIESIMKQQNNNSVEAIVQAVLTYADSMMANDVATNMKIGKLGAEWIADRFSRPIQILTHCNTGSLATAGYGTALGKLFKV